MKSDEKCAHNDKFIKIGKFVVLLCSMNGRNFITNSDCKLEFENFNDKLSNSNDKITNSDELNSSELEITSSESVINSSESQYSNSDALSQTNSDYTISSYNSLSVKNTVTMYVKHVKHKSNLVWVPKH